MRLARARIPRTAVVVLMLTILAATATIATWRHITDLKIERRVAANTAESVTVVADALRAQLTAAQAGGAALGQDSGSDDGHSAQLPTAITALARDSGEPVLDDSGVGALVVARYDTATQPTTVQERRDHLSGFRVLPLDLASTLVSLKPAHGGVALRGPNRQVMSAPSSRPGSAVSFTAPIGPKMAAGWTVTTWAAPAATPGTAWLLALVLFVLGGASAAWLANRTAESKRSQEELRGLQRTSDTVAELATLTQGSLDLGDVLPSVTTELASSLGLSGVSVTTPTPSGERPIFSWGASAEEGAPKRNLEELRAGQSSVLVLSRGGRIVAKLTVTAGRDLAHHDIRTLVAAGDLLTSALANAEAFSQQDELIRRMRAVDELKSAFLATASHELRTPVAAITGYASLLHTDWDEPRP